MRGFVHIPKTGGSSVVELLTRRSSAELFFRTMTSFPSGLPRGESIVSGHIPLSCWEQNDVDWKLCTILREPLERTISEYLYAREASDHYACQHIHSQGLSLADYIAHPILGMACRNFQTKMLGWRDSDEIQQPSGQVLDEFCFPYNFWLPKFWFAEPDETTLKRAEAALPKLGAFALLSSLDSVSRMIEGIFQVAPDTMPWVNKTPPTSYRLSQADMDAVRGANQLDLELYSFAKRLVAEQANGHLARGSAVNPAGQK